MMKLLKRLLLVFAFLILAAILFRGLLFRNLVTYTSLAERTEYSVTDDMLVSVIEKDADQLNNPDAEEVIKCALAITSGQLNYTTGKNPNDPNKLIRTHNAHCVGYASFFSSTCNYLLNKYGLSDTWTATPRAGQLYFMGTNMHSFFSSAFFKDQDFVTIENNLTGEVLAVDPTVNDYLYIDFITFTK